MPGRTVSAPGEREQGAPRPPGGQPGGPDKITWEDTLPREYETVKLTGEGPFILASGETLPEVELAYETWGRLNAERDNVILVCHALTGDSHVASHPERRDSVPGWWEEMVGPGKPLDTGKYFVLCSNVLGGCRGSTGPRSPHPQDGKPYGRRFPVITVRDMVRAQYRLLRHLGLRRIHLVIGGSLGGMQVLEWAATYPHLVDGALVIAAPERTGAQALAYHATQRQAILLAGPREGLALARMLGMITYQSWESMERKFGREAGVPAESPDREAGETYGPVFARPWEPFFQVEHYLHYQGQKLVARFAADTYLYLSRAMDLHDIGWRRGGLPAVLPTLTMPLLVVGISSDICFPAREVRRLPEALARLGQPARYVEIDSPWGHDAFLVEPETVGAIVREFLNELEAAGRATTGVWTGSQEAEAARDRKADGKASRAAVPATDAFLRGRDLQAEPVSPARTAFPREAPNPAPSGLPLRSPRGRSSVPVHSPAGVDAGE